MIGILYALNLLSRYGNKPGPRHIKFLKHLLQYVKYAKSDRLVFHGHDGSRDIETMTSLLQLRFQCDADLGGNPDNSHSQTAYLGYLGRNLICWCSTDQGSISTSTAELEIKAVNHTLKVEVIANRGILNMMGWIQGPTPIEEDNQCGILPCTNILFYHSATKAGALPFVAEWKNRMFVQGRMPHWSHFFLSQVEWPGAHSPSVRAWLEFRTRDPWLQ